MSLLQLRRILTMESFDGVEHPENEWTFYGKVINLADLEKAPEKEEHTEQWKIPFDSDAPVRARIRLVNGRQYTMTTKVRLPGSAGALEVDSIISKDMYKHLRLVGVDGYKKTRYNFPIPGTNRKWEIDVFLNRAGGQHPWVKIDFEVGDFKEKIPELPIDFSEIIVDRVDASIAHKRFIRELWKNEWLRLDELGAEDSLKALGDEEE